MQAAILEKPGFFILEERPTPEPGEYDLRVRADVCGVCTSEVHMWQGRMKELEFPRFIGHEVSGTVTGAGADVAGFEEGDRVSVYAEGKGYAEEVVVPAAWAVKLAGHVPFEHALGEPIACSVNGVRMANPEIGDSVCLVGCGFMGLMLLQVFRAKGVGTLIAVDRRESVLALARELGATHTINGAETDVEEAIKDLTVGKGVDIGVETGGSQATLDLAMKLVRMEGKLEVFGFHMGEPRRVDWGYWNWMAFTIINAHNRKPETYVEGMRIGLDMVERGALKMAPLVTHHFPLENINEAFEAASEKQNGFVKGIIKM